MPFSFRNLEISGLIEIRPQIFGDERGYFLETYSSHDFTAAGIDAIFVQDNQSKSSAGVLRGLHFQKNFPQGKLVRAIEGEVFDVAVDLRANSPTFGRWAAVILRACEQNQFWIPPGFAHGFLVLSDSAVFAYKCTDFYHPEDEDGIKWDDADLDIEWPDIGVEPKLSQKDKALSAFDPIKKYFIDYEESK